jgi:SAM-dependent methyltransferase
MDAPGLRRGLSRYRDRAESGPPSSISARNPWTELFDGTWVVTGNVAKARAIEELHHLLDAHPDADVIDVGVVGMRPLEFWEPLLLTHPSLRVTGVDVADIERARVVADQRGWGDRVSLLHGSGYALAELFPPASFNVLVATQVLEHVSRLPLFMRQVGAVLRSGGQAFFTVDSAHFRSRFDPRYPLRLAKNLVKKGLSFVGDERHYDLPWLDREVASAAERAGLEVQVCNYYNLAPLKLIHNRLVPTEDKNAVLRRWLELEEALNESERVRLAARHMFSALYFQVTKR